MEENKPTNEEVILICINQSELMLNTKQMRWCAAQMCAPYKCPSNQYNNLQALPHKPHIAQCPNSPIVCLVFLPDWRWRCRSSIKKEQDKQSHHPRVRNTSCPCRSHPFFPIRSIQIQVRPVKTNSLTPIAAMRSIHQYILPKTSLPIFIDWKEKYSKQQQPPISMYEHKVTEKQSKTLNMQENEGK